MAVIPDPKHINCKFQAELIQDYYASFWNMKLRKFEDFTHESESEINDKHAGNQGDKGIENAAEWSRIMIQMLLLEHTADFTHVNRLIAGCL